MAALTLTTTVRTLLTVLAGLLLLALVTPTASAALGDDTAPVEREELSLSSDGRTWTAGDLEQVLFRASAWVPGETRTATFWVRNDAPVAADVDVLLTRGAADAMVSHGRLDLAGAAASGAFQAVDPSRDRHVVRVDDLGAGEAVPVHVRASLSPLAPRGAAGVELRFRVELTGPVVTREPLSQTAVRASTAHLGWVPLLLGSALVGVLLGMRGLRRPDPGGVS